MDCPKNKKDEKFASLPFPLKNTGNILSLNPEEMLGDHGIFGSGNHNNQYQVRYPQADVAGVMIGRLSMLALRTTPCTTREEGGEFSTMALALAVDKYKYHDGTHEQEIEPGDIHLDPRTGGTTNVGYFSGIVCPIEHKRLARTIGVMGGSDMQWSAERSYALKSNRPGSDINSHSCLHAFLLFVDQLLRESTHLGDSLGLDEQVYRLLAFLLFKSEDKLDKIASRWTAPKYWKNPLDELVDYIRQNAHLSLTLTDLEEQSHYSGRQLQNLFKEKFDCTPMQFVRRQRLASAMEKLQTAGYGDTVTSISRDIGYRYTSNLCTDFQREFGVTPSVVLRSSRGGKIACQELRRPGGTWNI